VNLGKMHKCSYGFIPIGGSLIRKDDPDWYKTFNRRFLQLLQFNNIASKYDDEFSRIYISCFDYFIQRARHAVHILSQIDNKELMEPAEKYNTICHLDYVNKNIIITDSGDVCVIDFDKSKVDIPIHDIGTFLKRILKRTNTSWDFRILSMALESYQSERILTQVEFLGLFAYLEFPQKYWKISRDYFNNRKNCNKKMFISMLSKACEQKDDHDQFCGQFQDYIEQKFNINLKN
jgi:CotS family spore coat protein